MFPILSASVTSSYKSQSRGLKAMKGKDGFGNPVSLLFWSKPELVKACGTGTPHCVRGMFLMCMHQNARCDNQQATFQFLKGRLRDYTRDSRIMRDDDIVHSPIIVWFQAIGVGASSRGNTKASSVIRIYWA